MRRGLFITLFVLLTPPAWAQSPCQLVGVWELVSGTMDGSPYPTTMHQLKFITKTRWAFVARDDPGIKEMKTAADTLRVLRSTGMGSGTYSLQGTTYTETVEFFSDPDYIGQSVSFTCRTEGDRFYQSGTFPIFQGGRKVREAKLEEVYRRIE